MGSVSDTMLRGFLVTATHVPGVYGETRRGLAYYVSGHKMKF